MAALLLVIGGGGAIIPASAHDAPGLQQTVQANLALATPTVPTVPLAEVCQDNNQDGTFTPDECRDIVIGNQGSTTKLVGLQLHYHIAGGATLPTVRADAGAPDECKGRAGIFLTATGSSFRSDTEVTVTTTDANGTSTPHHVVRPVPATGVSPNIAPVRLCLL